MVKKPGQPDNAMEMTAGRTILLAFLRRGYGDSDHMAQAANWLRDLTVHHGESVKRLMDAPVYRELYERRATSTQVQQAAADWIESLLLTAKENYVMTPNEQREALGLPPLANETQVGGDHYQKPIQHWDFVTSHDYGYLEGQITKYLFRWRDKNGVQDLQKASHFLQKLAEVSESDAAPINLQDFLDANDIPESERIIFVSLHAYHGTLDPTFLIYAQDAMRRLLARAGGKTP